MDIKIYGTGTSGHQMVFEKLNESLTNAHVPFHIENIENVSSFITDMLHSIPAIRVDDNDLYEISMNGRFNSSLRAAIQAILKKKNYGSMTKIIVPTDFSDISFNAYNFARNLAKVINGVLYVTHVYFPNSVNINEITYVDSNAEDVYRKKLDEFVRSINQDWIGDIVREPFVEAKFITGFPHKEIISLSEEPESMIVMGSTGSGDQFKKLFGSLSIDVMKHAHCPVFVIPRHVHVDKIQHVLFCSESLEKDVNAVLKAGELCQRLGAKLYVGHIVTRVGDQYHIQNLENLLNEYFKELNYEIHMVESKSAALGIAEIMGKIPVDLLVFNTKHRNFFSSLIHHSVTEDMALYADKAILVYHQE